LPLLDLPEEFFQFSSPYKACISEKQRIIIIIIIIIIMFYVEAKGSTSDPDSNIIYGGNSKVTITV